MEKQNSLQHVLRAVVLILLSCLPLVGLVFGMFAGLPAKEPIITLLPWWQLLLLGVCVTLPLLVLPHLGVNWSSHSRRG